MEVASLALFKKDKILIVRDRYEDFWTLPGGKIKDKETRRQAVKRELSEELPLLAFKDLSFLGEFFGVTPHSRQCLVINVFLAKFVGGSVKPHREITGSRWIRRENKKLKMTQSTQNIINSIYTRNLKAN